MNLIKNLMTTELPLKMERSFVTSQKLRRPEEGLCVTCSNKPYCIWVESNKQLCEHFD